MTTKEINLTKMVKKLLGHYHLLTDQADMITKAFKENEALKVHSKPGTGMISFFYEVANMVDKSMMCVDPYRFPGLYQGAEDTCNLEETLMDKDIILLDNPQAVTYEAMKTLCAFVKKEKKLLIALYLKEQTVDLVSIFYPEAAVVTLREQTEKERYFSLLFFQKHGGHLEKEEQKELSNVALHVAKAKKNNQLPSTFDVFLYMTHLMHLMKDVTLEEAMNISLVNYDTFLQKHLANVLNQLEMDIQIA